MTEFRITRVNGCSKTPVSMPQTTLSFFDNGMRITRFVSSCCIEDVTGLIFLDTVLNTFDERLATWFLTL